MKSRNATLPAVFCFALVLTLVNADSCNAIQPQPEPIQVEIETEASKKQSDELEAKAISLFWEKQKIAIQTCSVKKLANEIEKYFELYESASNASTRAYQSGRLETQLSQSDKANKYLATMHRKIAEETRAINKEIWDSLDDDDRDMMAQFMTFLARDGKADSYLASRPNAQVPKDWTLSKNTDEGFQAHAPSTLKPIGTGKRLGKFESKYKDESFVFQVTVHDLKKAHYSTPFSAKKAAENVAFDKGPGLEFSGSCKFANKQGHEVEFIYGGASARRVSVRAVKSGDKMLVFSCERDLRNISTRIPNAFFDSVSLVD